MDDRFDISKMTLEDLFRTREQRKIERSRRLARLPIAKKLGIVEKFRDILNEALTEDGERRAANSQSTADKN